MLAINFGDGLEFCSFKEQHFETFMLAVKRRKSRLEPGVKKRTDGILACVQRSRWKILTSANCTLPWITLRFRGDAKVRRPLYTGNKVHQERTRNSQWSSQRRWAYNKQNYGSERAGVEIRIKVEWADRRKRHDAARSLLRSSNQAGGQRDIRKKSWVLPQATRWLRWVDQVLLQNFKHRPTQPCTKTQRGKHNLLDWKRNQQTLSKN